MDDTAEVMEEQPGELVASKLDHEFDPPPPGGPLDNYKELGECPVCGFYRGFYPNFEDEKKPFVRCFACGHMEPFAK